jgi:hypothetical protein
MSIEDYIKNATRNLQNVAAAMPGNDSGVAGAAYLGFNGNTGQWKFNKEIVDPKSLGLILVPEHGIYEGMVEWANGSALQKCKRPLRGVAYDEPMTERLLKKPLSPGAYRQDTDGPAYMMGFAGLFLDDGATTVFEHTSGGSPSGRCRLRRACPPGHRAWCYLVRFCQSDGAQSDAHRRWLRHRQAGAGGRCPLR